VELPTVPDKHVQSFIELTHLDLFNETTDISEYEMNFYYAGQPIYFDITPRKGELLRPRSERTASMILIPPKSDELLRLLL